MHRALVSGVTGHLGSELARQLHIAGVEVHGLTRAGAAIPPESDDSIELHSVDGSTQNLIAVLCAVRPDIVFHLAGLARRAHRSEDVSPFIAANISFGTQLLEGMRACRCKRFVTAGSYLQHFKGDVPHPLNLYAATKQAFETLIEYYADAFDMSAVRLTLCDIYSERDTRPKLMTDIAAAWAGDSSLTLRSAEAYVDLIHVQDAACAFMHIANLLETHAIPERALTRYSVSSGHDTTATELIQIFERIGHRRLTVHRAASAPAVRDMKPWRGDGVPGWAPRISIDEGIGRIIANLYATAP